MRMQRPRSGIICTRTPADGQKIAYYPHIPSPTRARALCRRVMKLAVPESELREVFQRLAADGSGSVSIEELLDMGWV